MTVPYSSSDVSEALAKRQGKRHKRVKKAMAQRKSFAILSCFMLRGRNQRPG